MSLRKGSKVAVTLTSLTLITLSLYPTSAIDVESQKENYIPDYRSYHNLSRTVLHLKKLASKHSDVINIDWTYQSKNGLPQLLTRISSISSPSASSLENLYLIDDSKLDSNSKVRVLLSYGEHAREFFPTESFFHLLNNITSGLSSTADVHAQSFSNMILSRFDIYVIVMANPDGRKIMERSENYCWRGTSTGVDINRNFDWQFAQKGSSSNPGDEEFRGPYAFSEPECKVFVDLTQKLQFDAFFSFHSGVRHIYMPFADTASKASRRAPLNFKSQKELCGRLSTATKHRFLYGQAFDLNFYTADGTAFDYMAGVRQIPFSLAIEMWKNKDHTGRSCFDEFNPRSEQLMRELEDFHPMYVEMFSYLHQWKRRQLLSASNIREGMEGPTLTLSYVLMAGTVFVCVIMGYKKRQYIFATKRRIVHLRRLSSTFSMGGIFR